MGAAGASDRFGPNGLGARTQSEHGWMNPNSEGTTVLATSRWASVLPSQAGEAFRGAPLGGGVRWGVPALARATRGPR